MRRLLLCSGLLVACSNGEVSDVADVADSGEADVTPGDTAAGTDTGTDVGTDVTDTALDTTPVDAPIDRTKCVADPDKLGQTTRSATYKGGKINYLAFAPPGYEPKSPLSLVVALHGAGDTSANYFAAIWQGTATSKKFLVITPEGSSPAGAGFTWNSGDANLVLAAIEDFELCYSVDTHRRIVDGFSAGGIMAYLLGLASAETFAGISIASANEGSAEALFGGSLLPATWKIPVSHFHGVDDLNFTIASARAGRDKLLAAGHTVHWHEFAGGHSTKAADAAQRYDDLASSKAP